MKTDSSTADAKVLHEKRSLPLVDVDRIVGRADFLPDGRSVVGSFLPHIDVVSVAILRRADDVITASSSEQRDSSPKPAVASKFTAVSLLPCPKP
jgi:hypothetical protein